MEYQLKIADQSATVKIESKEEENQFHVVIGDREIDLYADLVAAAQFLVQAADQPASSLYVADCPEGRWVWNKGKARLVQDVAQMEARRSRRKGLGGGPKIVTPPTPATVIAVNVEVGQEVEKDQALVVVSAMKMEITLVAPYAGVVKAVNTKEGAKANPGDVLVDIEPEQKEEEPDE